MSTPSPTSTSISSNGAWPAVLGGSGKKLDATDVDLFRAHSDVGAWTQAKSVKDAVQGVQATMHELGIAAYQAPASPELCLADFIRAALSTPEGYDRVLLRNADGSMTLFRSSDTRKQGRLQTAIESSRYADANIHKWKKFAFTDEHRTTFKDLDKFGGHAFRGNEDYFRQLFGLSAGSPSALTPLHRGSPPESGDRTLRISATELIPVRDDDFSRALTDTDIRPAGSRLASDDDIPTRSNSSDGSVSDEQVGLGAAARPPTGNGGVESQGAASGGVPEGDEPLYAKLDYSARAQHSRPKKSTKRETTADRDLYCPPLPPRLSSGSSTEEFWRRDDIRMRSGPEQTKLLLVADRKTGAISKNPQQRRPHATFDWKTGKPFPDSIDPVDPKRRLPVAFF